MLEAVLDCLMEARAEIIAGLVLALLGWLYTRWRAFMKMYRRKKQELERMNAEIERIGATQQEFERLQEALRQSEAKGQDTQKQLEELQAELQRRDDALKQAEAQQAEESRCNAAPQKTVTPENPKLIPTPKLPAMSDEVFVARCKFGDAFGDAKEIEEAILNAANVNAKDNVGRTALMSAAEHGHIEIAELLLKHGADVNAKANKGITALMSAARDGRTEVAEVLLAEEVVIAIGADVPGTQLLDFLLGVHGRAVFIGGICDSDLVNIAIAMPAGECLWFVFHGIGAQEIVEHVLHSTRRAVEVDAEVAGHLELALPDRRDVLERIVSIQARLGNVELVIRGSDDALVVQEADELYSSIGFFLYLRDHVNLFGSIFWID